MMDREKEREIEAKSRIRNTIWENLSIIEFDDGVSDVDKVRYLARVNNIGEGTMDVIEYLIKLKERYLEFDLCGASEIFIGKAKGKVTFSAGANTINIEMDGIEATISVIDASNNTLETRTLRCGS